MMLTLLQQASPLASPSEQRRLLEDVAHLRHPRFDQVLGKNNVFPMRAAGIEVLQVNLGKLCNQTCRHCHVDAGPARREIMSRETAAACLDVLSRTDIATLDLTGGAPEMNPNFRWLVRGCRRLGRRVIDRCNLTILVAPGFEDLPEFLARHQVEVVASLPCYLEENTDNQRGEGVFAKSLEALRRLNALGYGKPDSELTLTLVYNPRGPALPPSQEKLSAAYRRELQDRYGIVFNRLFTITNMPVGRFLDDLIRSEKYDEYLQKLIDSFNPATVNGLMCRTTLSVDWQGRLFDCDFNQMLELGVSVEAPQNIREFDSARLAQRSVVTGRHCFGCTAGCGSSCSGEVLRESAQ